MENDSMKSTPNVSAVPPPVVSGERVEEIGVFGSKTGELGTVVAADHTQAVVKWDDDGKELLLQQYLKRFCMYDNQA